MVRERWRIRRADVSDAERIAEVHVRSWFDAYSDLLPPEEFDKRPVELRLNEWNERLSDDDFVISLASDEEKALGFVGVRTGQDDDADPRTGEIAYLYLIEEAWGQGLGRKLLAVGVDCLGRRGFTRAVLWVLRDNDRARRFYEANGWKDDGGAKDCFGGANAPAVRYALEFGEAD